MVSLLEISRVPGIYHKQEYFVWAERYTDMYISYFKKLQRPMVWHLAEKMPRLKNLEAASVSSFEFLLRDCQFGASKLPSN